MSRAWLALLGLVAGCQGCVNGVPTPATVQGIDTGVCVLTQFAVDPACRPKTGNALTCGTDVAKACGILRSDGSPDVASVNKLLDAHVHAMVADGVVPPPTADQ